MTSIISAIFNEVNLLVFTPLVILLAIWLILGLAQPVCVFIDCAGSDLEWKRKTFWLMAMIFSLGLASMIYPWFNPTGKVMRVADRVMLSPLLILFLLYFLLYCFHDGVRALFNYYAFALAGYF